MMGDNREIKELRKRWESMSKEEKEDTLWWKLIWWHHTKHIPGAPPRQAISRLADVIESADKSSNELSKSIRNATWVGGLAATAGVIVSILHLFK